MIAIAEKLYVPVFQFFMNDELGFAYGTTGRAYHTYDEARRFLLDGGWELRRFEDVVYDEVREFFWKGDESAKIEEVVVVDG